MIAFLRRSAAATRMWWNPATMALRGMSFTPQRKAYLDDFDSGDEESIISDDEGEVFYDDGPSLARKGMGSTYSAQQRLQRFLPQQSTNVIKYQAAPETVRKFAFVNRSNQCDRGNVASEKLVEISRQLSNAVTTVRAAAELPQHTRASVDHNTCATSDFEPMQQSNFATGNRSLLSQETPNSNWRVNDWLTRAFPTQSKQKLKRTLESPFSKPVQVVNHVEHESTGQDEIVDDEPVPFTPWDKNRLRAMSSSSKSLNYGARMQGAHRSAANCELEEDIIDDFGSECVPFPSALSQQFSEREIEVLRTQDRDSRMRSGNQAAPSPEVSIRALFSGAVNKPMSFRSDESARCSTAKRRKCEQNRAWPSSECSQGTVGQKTPCTQRKLRKSSTVERGRHEDFEDIAEFSEEEPVMTAGDISGVEIHIQGNLASHPGIHSSPAFTRSHEACSATQNEDPAGPKTWMAQLQEYAARLPLDPNSRKYHSRSRNCRGELSARFQKYVDREQAEMKKFRSKLGDGGFAIESVDESQQSWSALILRKQYYGHLTVLSAEILRRDKASLESKQLDESPSPDVTCCNLVLATSAVKAISADVSTGTMLRIFQPWSIFNLCDGGIPIVLCLDRFVAGSHISAIEDVSAISTLQCHAHPGSILKVMSRQSDNFNQSKWQNLPNLSIYDYKEQTRASIAGADSSTSQEQTNVMIADIDSWIAEISLQGVVVRTCPRALLLRMSSDASTSLPLGMEPLHAFAATSTPSFWLVDSSGVVCEILVPSDCEAEWTSVLLDISAPSLQLTKLSVLDRQARKKRYDQAIEIRGRGLCRVCPYTLVISPLSTFKRCPPRLKDDITRLAGSPVPLQELLHATAQTTPARADIIVRVLRIEIPRIKSRGEPFHELEMCVWDPSLRRATTRNILLTVCEPAQCLACSAILSIGDTILVKDACIQYHPQANSKNSPIAFDPPELSLVVDDHSLICFINLDDENRDSVRNGAFGYVLPSISKCEIEKLLECDGGTSNSPWNWESWPLATDIRDIGAGVEDSFVQFCGIVAKVDQVQLIDVCPCCSCRNLLIGNAARDGQAWYICSMCENISREFLQVVDSVQIVLDSGMKLTLRSSIVEDIVGDCERNEDAVAERISGCKLRGVCVVKLEPQKSFDLGQTDTEKCDVWKAVIVDVICSRSSRRGH